MAAKKKSTSARSKESPTGAELLVLELQAIHSAESQLSRVAPSLARATESRALREMMNERIGEGERIIEDIESVFEELEESPGRRKNLAAEGLINDAREHVQEIEAGPALDSVLIAALQKTEHYCIAAWGTARALAKATGQKAAEKAMDRAIKVGAKFDERLTQLAEQEVTPALLGQESEAENDDSPSRPSKNSGSEQRGTTR
jgi:ferritin-like metal-binding protein YciE